MHGMASAISDHAAQNLFSEEGQVPDQVQDLVANKFVTEAQGAVQQALTGEHYRIFSGRAPDQALVAHGIGLVKKSESAGRRDLTHVLAIGQFHLKSLAP